MRVLVVGGAGYIGSHCVRQLIEHGYNPVVLDNLAAGHRAAVNPDLPFYYADIADEERVRDILRREKIEIVMHFAAHAYVGESVTNPMKYYLNNVVGTIHLLNAMLAEGMKQFVFSSTCATYGTPKTLPITENEPQQPINPYGQTKLDVENCLKALAHSDGLSFAAFRYFNAAGCAEDGSLGEVHNPETHLIPLVLDVALGKRDSITVFGNDYNTPDGTCLRDYIHVDDLARAHIAVFDKLKAPGQAYFYNLGTGKPVSVLEIIQTAEKVTGKKIPIKMGTRREGDPAVLYADPAKAVKELTWEVEYDTIESIIQSAWNWQKNHPDGYKMI